MRDWLKEYRLEQELTQLQVAEMSDMSRSHYTHVEQGNKTPSVAVAKRIANTLDFDWTLFFDSDSSVKEQDKTA